jgi:phage terminase large subunit GpA-like protein
MLNVKCFHCGKSFALNEDVVAAWLEEHKEEQPKHYPAQCHFCRRVIKLSIEQVSRHLPARSNLDSAGEEIGQDGQGSQDEEPDERVAGDLHS